MIKNLKTVRAGIVMGILFVSIFTMFVPGVSAWYPVMEVGYDGSKIPDSVTPITGKLSLPIEIKYMVAGLGSTWALGLIESQMAQLTIRVKNTPDWCKASINPSAVPVKISSSYASANATLYISFTENAPAFQSVPIEIAVEAPSYFSIDGGNATGVVQVKPGYSGSIDIAYPDGTSKEVSPGTIVDFHFVLDNRGNARTVIEFDILDYPEGWNPSIETVTTLGSKALGEETKKTINFDVQTPFGIGYHNQPQRFRVNMKTWYERDPTFKGPEYTLLFNIRNRGFSIPGFEGVFLVIALLAVTLIFKKWQK